MATTLPGLLGPGLGHRRGALQRTGRRGGEAVGLPPPLTLPQTPTLTLPLALVLVPTLILSLTLPLPLALVPTLILSLTLTTLTRRAKEQHQADFDLHQVSYSIVK